MKEIHQTLDSWRPNQRKDGWKMLLDEWISLFNSIKDDVERNKLLQIHNDGHPDRVKPVHRLASDLNALKQLFAADKPKKLCVRYRKCIQAIMGIGDSSKSGFGYSFLSNDEISYVFGT